MNKKRERENIMKFLQSGDQTWNESIDFISSSSSSLIMLTGMIKFMCYYILLLLLSFGFRAIFSVAGLI